MPGHGFSRQGSHLGADAAFRFAAELAMSMPDASQREADAPPRFEAAWPGATDRHSSRLIGGYAARSRYLPVRLTIGSTCSARLIRGPVAELSDLAASLRAGVRPNTFDFEWLSGVSDARSTRSERFWSSRPSTANPESYWTSLLSIERDRARRMLRQSSSSTASRANVHILVRRSSLRIAIA